MKISPVFAGLIATLLAACDWDVGIRGNGHVVTIQQQVGTFSEVSGRGALRIEWHAGAPALSITTDENLIGEFEARTNGNRLELRVRNRVRATDGIQTSLQVPSVKE